MNKICDKCYALKWKNETKGFCCLNGKVVLTPLHEVSLILHHFLTSNDLNTNKPYVDNIRAYNSILAFTSLGANIDEELANAKEGIYTFQIQGALYHRIGGLMPKEKLLSVFAQIYFYDSDMDKQLERRQEIFPHLNSDMLNALQTELYNIENPFVHNFITAGEQARSRNDITDMRLVIHHTHGKDMKQYNKPTANEVAVIFLDFDDVLDPRDIVIKYHEDKLKHINELHGAYDPLQYPLLFPYGEYEWHDSIFKNNIIMPSEPESEHELPMEIDEEEIRHTGATQDMDNLLIGSEISKRNKGKSRVIEVESNDEYEKQQQIKSDDEQEIGDEQAEIKRKQVTIKEFIVYRIQIRDSNRSKNILHLSGRLFQQYLVDQYAKWKSNNLRWYRNNQQNLRQEIYSGLQDFASDEDAIYSSIGKKIILLSSFTRFYGNC